MSGSVSGVKEVRDNLGRSAGSGFALLDPNGKVAVAFGYLALGQALEAKNEVSHAINTAVEIIISSRPAAKPRRRDVAEIVKLIEG